MTVPIELQGDEPRVLPMNLLVRSGVGAGFEGLSEGVQRELLRRRSDDASEAIERAEVLISEHRAILMALAALGDYMTDPNPEKTIYRVLETN